MAEVFSAGQKPIEAYDVRGGKKTDVWTGNASKHSARPQARSASAKDALVVVFGCLMDNDPAWKGRVYCSSAEIAEESGKTNGADREQI